MSDDSICASLRGALFFLQCKDRNTSHIGSGVSESLSKVTFLEIGCVWQFTLHQMLFLERLLSPANHQEVKDCLFESIYIALSLRKIHIAPDLIECRLSVSRYSGFPFRNNIFARIDCEIYFACLHASTQVSMLLLVVHYQTKVCHCSFDAYHA